MEHQTVAPAIDGARSRRADLHAVIVDLEQAIAAAAPGREADWTRLVAVQLERLAQAFAHHVAATEGPDGLFEQVRHRSPRLDAHCRVLADEHGAISGQLATVMGALEADVATVRSTSLDLLKQLGRHRQGGADLVYEAYAVDIGGSE